MGITETNNILSQEEINKITKTMKEIWDSLVKMVKDIKAKILKIWNDFLLKLYSNNKKIRKINHIYAHTKNKRIRKKQISRLYKILKE